MRSLRDFFRLGLVLVFVFSAAASEEERCDVLFYNARIINPEDNQDLPNHCVCILKDKISFILPEKQCQYERSRVAAHGESAVDCAGAVLAPGFIDLHAHGQDNDSHRWQALDGVTTALELEVGVYPFSEWLERKVSEGSRVNFGAAVGHIPTRMRVMDKRTYDHIFHPRFSEHNVMEEGRWSNEQADPAELKDLTRRLQEGLTEGALGIGFGIAYTEAATTAEIRACFDVAGRQEPEPAPVYTHIRYPAGRMDGFNEVIDASIATGAPLHIAHIGSSAKKVAPELVTKVRKVNREILDKNPKGTPAPASPPITIEIYPYAAGSTRLESKLFDPGFQESMEMDYGDLEWVETGERLTEQTFHTYRKRGGLVVIHDQPQDVIDHCVVMPDVIIASDGIPFQKDGEIYRGHPRAAGTFSRVLGRYTGEGKLSLMDAVKKMTVLPARRLQEWSPQFASKGRIAPGYDADITVFDPESIKDQATYLRGAAPSQGIIHTMVNGVFVVRDTALVEDAMPGRPQLSRAYYEHIDHEISAAKDEL